LEYITFAGKSFQNRLNIWRQSLEVLIIFLPTVQYNSLLLLFRVYIC